MPPITGSRAVVEAALRRAGEVQAVHHPFTDILDTAPADLPEAGELAGVPVTVKDVLDVAGFTRSAGSAAFAEERPTADATCVARLRAAGAVVIAKTTTPEFGLSWTTAGPVSTETSNPFDPSRTAGGSSGGAAVSVAAGITRIAIGTDDAGSVRLPAAFCGTVGFVGTLGRVARDGIAGHSVDFTRIGVLGRDVREAALAERVMAGQLGTDDVAATVPTRVTWWSRPHDTFGIDSAMVDAVRAAAEGTHIVDIETEFVGFDTDDEAAFAVVNETDRWVLHGRRLTREIDTARLQPRTREIFERGASHSVEAYVEARARLDAGRAATEAQGILLAPTAACLPPPLGGRLEDRPPGITAYTLLSSAYGMPAVTVPCGIHAGIPLGLQVIGPRGSDRDVLALAAALEQALPSLPSPAHL